MLSIDIVPDVATVVISNITRWCNAKSHVDTSNGNHLLVLAI